MASISLNNQMWNKSRGKSWANKTSNNIEQLDTHQTKFFQMNPTKGGARLYDLLDRKTQASVSTAMPYVEAAGFIAGATTLGASLPVIEPVLSALGTLAAPELASVTAELGSLMKLVRALLGGVASRFKGFWKSKQDAANIRLIANSERVYSDTINKMFINEEAVAAGWNPPYPDDLSLRKITTGKELKLYRVHVDPNRVAGRFLAREKEIAPYLNNPEALRVHLGLPDVPIYITEVNVPVDTELLVGRIGPQPSFGLINKSGFQYQAVYNLPKSIFVNTKPLVQSKLKLGFE